MKNLLAVFAIASLLCTSCVTGLPSGELRPVEMTPVQAVRQLVKAASRGDREAVAKFMQPVQPTPPSPRDEKLEKEIQKAYEQTREQMINKCMELFAGRSRREFAFEELSRDTEAMLTEYADARISSEAGLKLTFHLLRIGGPFGRWSCYKLSE